MKHLILHSQEFLLVMHSFKEWLQTLGYSSKVIKGYPNHVKELLYYLEQDNIRSIAEINSEDIETFALQLRTRQNSRFGGGLSTSQINLVIQSIHKFLLYLKQSKQLSIQVELKREKTRTETIVVLTIEEIKAFLNSMETEQDPVMMRDKCMIALLYGAGLRMSELAGLSLDDVGIMHKTLLVRKAKGNKQRLIPLTDYTVQIIKEYIIQVRDLFTSISTTQEDALFIDIHGKRIPYDTCYRIIKNRTEQTSITSIQEKNIHPHVFRHSIATHLLMAGMPIEDIALFLGHSSLDSTMIYAHIAESMKP